MTQQQLIINIGGNSRARAGDSIFFFSGEDFYSRSRQTKGRESCSRMNVAIVHGSLLTIDGLRGHRRDQDPSDRQLMDLQVHRYLTQDPGSLGLLVFLLSLVTAFIGQDLEIELDIQRVSENLFKLFLGHGEARSRVRAAACCFRSNV